MLLMTSTSLFAQNEDDALRYSKIYFGGSARSVSTAGAFGALGGDYSLVSSNPAGLARFRKHNFSISQTIEMPSVRSDFYGNETRSFNAQYKISNLSYIKTYNLDPVKYSNWYGIQMGLGYNRIHSFEEDFRYGGTSDSSILHSFIKRANGTLPDNIYSMYPFDAALAYDTYALDPGPDNTYVTDFDNGTSAHNRSVYRSGGMGEYSFTLSGNYANKILVGGSFNLTRVKFYESYEHRETFTGEDLWLKSIRYLYDLDIEGWGYGARVGAIFLPKEWIRIGASVQTPTFFRLNDQWNANMFTDTESGMKYISEEYVPYGEYNYSLRTPMRANFNLGLVIKKKASLGVDVEYVDYTSSELFSRKFDEAPYSFTSENAQIKNLYRSVFNLRFGGELRLNEILYVRGGFATYASAFANGKVDNYYSTNFYTTGFGMNLGAFYTDAALVFRHNRSDYYAYDPTIPGSTIGLNTLLSSFTISCGFRFE